MKTHKELVSIAATWLRRKNCIPVITEMVTYNTSGEIPDAIGWTSRSSILIECKASRSDFLREREKPFRFDLPEIGVGDFRFYLTNPGVILSADEIPCGWGVYECDEKGKLVHRFGARYENAAKIPLTGNRTNELALLRSYIRRINDCTKGTIDVRLQIK